MSSTGCAGIFSRRPSGRGAPFRSGGRRPPQGRFFTVADSSSLAFRSYGMTIAARFNERQGAAPQKAFNSLLQQYTVMHKRWPKFMDTRSSNFRLHVRGEL